MSRELVQKVLESGLLDDHVAAMMERWGRLPTYLGDGYEQRALILKEELKGFASSLARELEQERRIQETNLDLKNLRFSVWTALHQPDGRIFCTNAMQDPMGKIYYRPEDVEIEKIVPGRKLSINTTDYTILERQYLYLGNDPVAIMVTVEQT